MELFGVVLLSALAVYSALTLAGELAARLLLPELSKSLLLVPLRPDTDHALLLWTLRQRGQRFLLVGGDARPPQSGENARQLLQRVEAAAGKGGCEGCCGRVDSIRL